MAFDEATSSVVLFGGSSNYLYDNDTWIWNGRWTQMTPATSPSARYGSVAAYDPTTRTVVLFGGQDSGGNLKNDTWTWNGVTWTQQFPDVSPSARVFDAQSMTYDAVTETLVLFGGQGGYFGDTWEWNGRAKTWKQDFPASSPSPRNTTLAYDPVTKEVVLFGGNNPTAGGPFLNDTWTWNGITWTQHYPASSPSPRGAPAFAYDPALGHLVLFGGTGGPPQAYSDTWLWNGITWTQLNLAQHPSARWAPGVAFDGGILLFGGVLAGDAGAGDTWIFIPIRIE